MDYSNELDPKVKEKMKKNLVYVGIFSIVMLFAGFTSAYIVSMGDSFWLKYPMPTGFWVSTCVIILSSITFVLAITAAKKDNQPMVKAFMVLTVLLGLAFSWFQFKGYTELVDNGIHPVNNHIVVIDGRYGDYFEFKYKGDFIEVDGNDYLLKGKKMSEADFKALQDFTKPFLQVSHDKALKAVANKDFEIYFQNQPLQVKNGHYYVNDSTQLQFVDETRLSYLALNIRDERGDFFVRGKIGKDFHVYYKNQELNYKNRRLEFKGRPLNNYLQIKAAEAADSASSYLFVITVLHLLHVLVALLYLIRLTIRSFSSVYTSQDNLSLRVGAIFWHFLGVLWVYLLLFLIFIH